MRRRALSPLNVLLVLMLVAVAPQQAFEPPSQQAAQPAPPQPAVPPQPVQLPLDLFKVPDGLEVTLWASSPLLRNPTNIDIDRDGRIWVAEGVRYRSHHARQPEGDKIVVLQDTDGDGKADSTHTFVQEPGLVAPLGVSVIDNKVIVAQPPDMIVYTDVDRNLRFDPAIDKREVLLTGFQGINHDHSLHSVTVGPDGKWVWNAGNMGAMFTDRSGKTFRMFSAYRANPVGPFKNPHDPALYAGKPSDDGHVYIGGFTARMNADGTNVEVIGHNYRNSYEQSVTSLGDIFQNDNDDPPACRVSWVMEYANFGFSSNDGQRAWQADRRPGQTVPVSEWRQDDPGMAPVGDVYGGGSPTGNVFYENGALGPSFEGMFLAADAGRNEIFSYQPKRQGAGFALDRKRLHHVEREAAVRRVGLRHGQRRRHARRGNALPAVGRRRRSRRRDLRQRLDRRARRWPPGPGRIAVWRHLPDRAQGVCLARAEVRRRDDRRTDHGAALAGGQRPGDRVRRA